MWHGWPEEQGATTTALRGADTLPEFQYWVTGGGGVGGRGGAGRDQPRGHGASHRVSTSTLCRTEQ